MAGQRTDDKLHVLLVDDDVFTARRLRRLLVSRGVSRVDHASTVAEALVLLEPPPDWVILDMNLPDGSGLAVLQVIRNAKLPTRVVLSSAMKDSELIAAFLAHTPDLIIPKPLNPALLPIGLEKDC
jgi:DNA-binding NarL/FixJ family response regulator